MPHISADGRIGVLFALDSFSGPKAGTEAQFWLLLSKLDRCRFKPGILLLEGSAWLDEHLPDVPKFVVGERRMRSTRFWKAAWCAVQRARASGYAVAHIWFNDSAIALPIPLRAAGFRVIVSRRDLGIRDAHSNKNWLRVNARFADLVICNAVAVRDVAIAREGFPSRKVRVIYNGSARTPQGVDRRAVRQIHKIPLDSIVACIVANLWPLKRVGDAIEATALLAARDIDLHLMIIGEDRVLETGSHRAELEALALRLSVGERVHFVGALANPMPLLEAADVGVLCSETEGLSNALIEYISAGLPVVCTAVGGNLEVVQADVSGLAVPVGCPAALADALGRLATDPNLRRRLGLAGRNDALTRFTPESMVAAHETAYLELCGQVS
jgi:L-malate glycosyltransferase